ncbi:MAG: hypothetical protein ABIQ35_00340, partial [Verrucomicrobiota bacterium]
MKPILLFVAILFIASAGATVKDIPFLQDVSVKFHSSPALTNSALRRLEIDHDGVIYVLTDHGVARTFDETLAPDRSFRPLSGLVARDIALGHGDLFYLFEDRWLSNGDSGKPLGHLPKSEFDTLAVADDGTVLLAGPGKFAWVHDGQLIEIKSTVANVSFSLFPHDNEFFALSSEAIYRIDQGLISKFHDGTGMTTLAFRERELLVGTHDGFYGLRLHDGKPATAPQKKLPVTDITCLVPVEDGIWAGTTRGAFFQRSSRAEKSKS